MVHAYNYSSTDLEYFSVRYTPKFQKPIELENYCCEGRLEGIYNRYDSLKYFESFCSKSGIKLNFNNISILEPVTSTSDIDLLITFNFGPTANAIETILHFYRDHFRNIIFCGNKEISKLHDQTRNQYKRFDSFTFIDMNEMDRGYHHYYCMTKAIEINFNVKSGILLMSDDVLFKYWHMSKLNKSKIWTNEKNDIGRDYKTIRNWHWYQREENKVKQVFQFLTEVIENKPISKNPGMKNYPGT
jgi:hypothetical protein